MGVERLRILPFVREDLLPKLGQLGPHRRVGEGLHDYGVEPGGDRRRYALGQPEPMPQRDVVTRQPRLVGRRDVRRGAQPGLGERR
jgi:hypothetical protein